MKVIDIYKNKFNLYKKVVLEYFYEYSYSFTNDWWYWLHILVIKYKELSVIRFVEIKWSLRQWKVKFTNCCI